MAKIYLIGNAHLDPVWLWRWQEGFSEIVSTFRSALDRMKDFPDFTFTSACAVYYQWIEKIDPDMFEEIKERVKEGRWSIVGGWFLQPDCNIPDGESFARHGLISQRYFKEKFGITAKTGYNVDSFGHNASLPQILKKSGMNNYVFMRPMPNEGNLKETLFNWESDDGSSVCTYRIPWFYNLDTSRMEMFERLKEKAENDNRDYMAFYGVGNHGGGPTIKLIDEINRMPIEGMVYSTPDSYFDEVDKSHLETVRGELQHHARGCYSACSMVKMQNRKCENNLVAAEKFSVMARELTGVKYPKDKLTKAWKNLLFNQFHDILGGCSIKKAYEDASYLYGETMSITEQAINFAMQKISLNIDTLGDEILPAYKTPKIWKQWQHEVLGTPIVVFNPHSWSVKMPVQINIVAKKMTDCDGNETAFQTVRGDQTNGNDKYQTAFMAEVGPMGYSVYRIFAEKESAVSFANELMITERSIENSKIRVEFDAVTGDVSLFYDKETNKYINCKPCSAVVIDETECDTWAHGKDKLGQTIGAFGNPEFSIIENGPIRATLKVKTVYNNSVLFREYTVIPKSKVVSVKTVIYFSERHRALKFAFQTDGSDVIAKIPYSTVTREQNQCEEPFGSWFAVGDLCVANDSKYGYDTEDGCVRMTVLRNAIYADHYALPCGSRDEFCEFMEEDRQEFYYSLFPYENNAQAERRASELNFGLRYVWTGFHKGTLPEKMNCMECDNDNIIVSAVKESETGEDKIIRFYEMNGCDTEVSIKLFGNEIKSDISHNEIKTFNDKGKELDLIEWEIEP
ncbi:MAG: alpha-mannosidase [Eubacteriales bacterium]